MGLNTEFTFETFVHKPHYDLAYQEALKAAELNPLNPPRNPLYFWGGIKWDRIHLVHAIANRALEKGHRTLLVTIPEFIDRMQEAQRADAIEDFRFRVRTPDVLVVHDLQYLTNYPELEEEFFHTIDDVRNNKGQLVLSSDVRLQSLVFQRVPDELKSRFQWGLIAGMDPEKS